jgi:hypothetical protein
MVGRNTHESDVHDLSLSVIHALAMVDAKALSYMQLRRLFAALTHALEDVERETTLRSEGSSSGDTVSVRAVTPPDT